MANTRHCTRLVRRNVAPGGFTWSGAPCLEIARLRTGGSIYNAIVSALSVSSFLPTKPSQPLLLVVTSRRTSKSLVAAVICTISNRSFSSPSPPYFFFSLFFDPACYYKIFDRWSGVAARLDILRSVNWKNWETTSDESGKECRWMDITDFKSFFLQLLLLNYSPRLFVRSASASNEILEFSHRSLASFDEIRFVARKTRSLRLQSSSKISTTFLPSID